ncbi:T9SS type A sorting domain-containing protein [Halocola ammonii]
METRIGFTVVLFFAFLSAKAQCPQCEPNLDCGETSDIPTVCPEILPPATAGEYYEETLTFYLPENFQDPESGLDVQLTEVLLEGITGLPFGLEVTLDDEDGIYQPDEGQNYGCATVCGTPLVAGDYITQTNILATAIVFGSIESQVSQSFPGPFTVLPGESSNASFSFDNLAACDSLWVNFEATIDGSPNETLYFWDFGNGNTSSLPNPPTQLYTEPGEHIASLETQVVQPILQSVQLTDIGSGWSGDLEEPFDFFPYYPDPYFVVRDGDNNSVYTSFSEEDVNSFLWTGIDLPLDNPPYTVQFFDFDELSSDDLIETVSLSAISGSQNFSNSGTEGAFFVGNEVLNSFYNEETVTVFPLPDAEFQFDENDNTLTFSDTTLTTFYWFLNGQQLTEESDSVLTLENPGVYTAVVENLYGCSATSEEFVLCPDPQIQFDEENNQLFVTEGFLSYQWFLDGTPIEGETENAITPVTEGNYSVQITTNYGCEVLSEVFILGVENLLEIVGLKVFPNPSDGDFQFEWKSNLGEKLTVRLYDSKGSLVLSKSIRHEGQKSIFEIRTPTLNQGVYSLRVHSSLGVFYRKVVIH